MTREYDNTNQGALFPAREKRTDRSPDYTGKIDINGTEFWLSAWVNESRGGSEYLKLKLGDEVGSERRPSGEATSAPRTLSRPNGGTSSSAGEASGRRSTPANAPGQQGFDDMDDDIPF